MEIMVREAFSAAILINSVIAPEQLDLNICRVGLLTNPVLHLLLLCIPNFRPTIVIRNPWRGIGVNHGNNAAIGLNHIHRLHLFHLLYMGFNKGDFLLIQPIFPVKLLVDLWNRLGPVDIGMRGEILEGDKVPFSRRISLRFLS